MSFAIFIQSFNRDGPATYSRRIAEEIFNRDAVTLSVPLSEVKYADGRVEIYGADDDEIDGVMVSRFCRTAFARAFELADATNAVIIWPGDEPFMAVTRPDVLLDLPEELKGENIAVTPTTDELIIVMKLIFSD